MEGIVSHVKVTHGIQNRRGMIQIYILKSSFWLSCGQWDFSGKKKNVKNPKRDIYINNPKGKNKEKIFFPKICLLCQCLN